ncbi:hypothetical protein SAMN05444001_103109 [Parabacteroides chinchillae]|uniref:Uncharacterized protein n=1 Tax=Parabacteroides chinchillae TaxID=871327 RepID=A0A8G2F3K3_9BACT|nr:hypothetical protein SAMN05444001_103109 [Parabacteroides chinchillae]
MTNINDRFLQSLFFSFIPNIQTLTESLHIYQYTYKRMYARTLYIVLFNSIHYLKETKLLILPLG